MGEHWMTQEARRAAARLEQVNLELKQRTSAPAAKTSSFRAGPVALPPVPAVYVQPPVVQVPPSPAPTVQVAAPQVNVRVEPPALPQPAVFVEGPHVTVAPTPVQSPEVRVDLGGAMAQFVDRLAEGLRGAVIVNVAPPQVVVNVPEAQVAVTVPPAQVVTTGPRKATITHRVLRDAQGQIVGSTEERTYES